MNSISDLIETKIGIPLILQVQILKTILLLVGMAFFYRLLKKLLFKTIKNLKTYYQVKKVLVYVFFILTVVLIARVWFTGVSSITTFLGLFTAGLAITLKDIILNVVGWAYIVWKGPFRVGDRIEINNVVGDVIDLQLFEFALMETNNWVKADQSTGRIVYIPNSFVFKEATFNFSKGIPFIWNEIPIHVTFESNWEKAKSILEDIAKKHGESISEKAELSIKEASKKFFLYDAKIEPKVYTSIDKEYSITLNIRYMCSYKKRRDSSEKIYEEILREFKRHDDIEFAYPTQRIYDRGRESKDNIQ